MGAGLPQPSIAEPPNPITHTCAHTEGLHTGLHGVPLQACNGGFPCPSGFSCSNSVCTSTTAGRRLLLANRKLIHLPMY